MSPEIPQSQAEHESFQLSELEQLFKHMSYSRFMQLIEHKATTIIRAEMSSNAFGEFLFVTTQQEEDYSV